MIFKVIVKVCLCFWLYWMASVKLSCFNKCRCMIGWYWIDCGGTPPSCHLQNFLFVITIVNELRDCDYVKPSYHCRAPLYQNWLRHLSNHHLLLLGLPPKKKNKSWPHQRVMLRLGYRLGFFFFFFFLWFLFLAFFYPTGARVISNAMVTINSKRS